MKVAHAARDEVGVYRACDSKGTSWTYAAEWREPQHARRRGADAVTMCAHGSRAVCCSGCSAWHCACPGSPAHVCAEAA